MTEFGYQDKNRISFSYNSTDTDAKAQSFSNCDDTYNLVFVRGGSGKCVIEGREYPITAGSVLIAKPLEYYYVEIATDTHFAYYILSFSLEDLTDANREMLECATGECRCLCALDESYDALLSAFERLQTAARLFDTHVEAYCRTLLAEIICLLSIARISVDLTDEGDLGFKVIKYIGEYITRDLTLDFLSKRFLVSKYYICRAFKKHNGISVHGYIVQKRIMLAKQLIESGIGAAVAAKQVGFCDYSAFYRAFVRIIGRPPFLTRT